MAQSLALCTHVPVPEEARITYWQFPLDGGDPTSLGTDWDGGVNDANIAEVTRMGPEHWKFELVASYETLTLEITCARVEDAAWVYAVTLDRSALHQG